MPKIQFSDVTPPGKRSIRNIPIPNSGRRRTLVSVRPEGEASSDSNSRASEATERGSSGAYEYYYPKSSKGSGGQGGIFQRTRKKTFIFGIAIAIVVVIFIVSMMTIFASATIDIGPKTQDIEVETTIAVITGEVADDAVRYEEVRLSNIKTTSIPATGEEVVELKASGKIVIYNNFSSEPQRLIVRTRFESLEGLIYRIPESVVVPGKTIKNGVSTPGSIEVEVFADEPGEKYNIKKTDFTIPGFKNDASRYEKFYARSATDMSGGFVGKRKTVLPTDKETALQNIDKEAEVELERDLQSKVPESFTLLPGAIMYESQELPQKEGGSSVILGKEVTAYAAMFNKQDLSDKIINEYISKSVDWDGIKAVIADFSFLKVIDAPSDLKNGSNVDLKIKGKVKVVADIDTGIISQRLLGVPKKEAAKLIDEFAGISSVTATVRPIWKQCFPNNPSKIYVRVVTND